MAEEMVRSVQILDILWKFNHKDRLSGVESKRKKRIITQITEGWPGKVRPTVGAQLLEPWPLLPEETRCWLRSPAAQTPINRTEKHFCC